MPDLTTAVDAGARAHFERLQADWRPHGRQLLRDDGHPYTWDELPAVDKHAVRSFVVPIVQAVLDTLPPDDA
jgi:hypothetical protein